MYTGKDVLSNVACSVCPGRPMYGGSHMSMLIRDFHFPVTVVSAVCTK